MIWLCAALSLTGCGGGSSSNGGADSDVTYEVRVSIDGAGTIAPTSQNVKLGETVSFTLVAESGYQVDSVTGCGGVLENNIYTTAAVTENCTVTAHFVTLSSTPQNLIAQPGDEKINLSWRLVSGASSYNLYYATESNIDPNNYASFDNGQMVQNISSPYTLTGLENGTQYFLIITSVVNGTESAASNEVSATPSVPTFENQLNDTGIDFCANKESNDLACPLSSFPDQDAQVGRDARAKAGTLSKVGGGAAGFDFTKLDSNGNDLPASATEWNCVRDNVTGLIWEVKTLNGLHFSGNGYSWYNPDETTNGGNAGLPNAGNTGLPDFSACIGSDCDTEAFKNAVNIAGWCGSNDWRLPTLGELQSIVDKGKKRPAIDTDYFPNTSILKFYTWTSSPIADIDAGVDFAWAVSFDAGISIAWGKTGGAVAGARLVRGGR